MEKTKVNVESKVYTVPEIIRMLNLSRAAGYRFIENDPPFKVIKVGRVYRIPKKSFDEWFENYELE